MPESPPQRILVTGATGFVGRALMEHLLRHTEHRVRALVRRPLDPATQGRRREPEVVVCDDLAGGARADGVCDGVDAVVHLAARVHQFDAHDPRAEAEYRRVNVDGTVALADAAARAGVSRFVFLSSIKVNGEETPPGVVYDELSTPHPQDAYGRTKLAAEEALWARADGFERGVVIVRPPLVYGPGVKANFATLVRLVRTGLPLPFGATRNARSLVGLPNLVDFLLCCVEHPAAANQLFMVSDGPDVSIAELVEGIARAGASRRLINLPVPPSLLAAGMRAVGRGPMARRLLGDLRLDSGKARRVLGWQPPATFGAVLEATVDGDGAAAHG